MDTNWKHLGVLFTAESGEEGKTVVKVFIDGVEHEAHPNQVSKLMNDDNGVKIRLDMVYDSVPLHERKEADGDS